MQLVVSGNHDAFAEIVERHTDRFFALAFRTLQEKDAAEDVVQAAFIKLWQKPDSWNSEKSRFTTWFYRVVMNACHDHQRKHSRLTRVDEHILHGALDPMHSEQHLLEEEQEARWQKQCLEYAMRLLPASQQDALNLVVYCALPQKQAAEIMGVSLKALESLLVRAKRSLAKTVQELERDSMKVLDTQVAGR